MPILGKVVPQYHKETFWGNIHLIKLEDTGAVPIFRETRFQKVIVLDQ